MNELTTDNKNNLARNEEGYLLDFSQWTPEVAQQIANEEKIELTDKHWEVISFLQDCYRKSMALSIRTFGKGGPVSIKELYALFPNGPLKQSTKIAGIPKPAGCV